jgi:hypothetical protein
VKATYSGFATGASGQYNQELEKDFTSIVESLLDGRMLPGVAMTKEWRAFVRLLL